MQQPQQRGDEGSLDFLWMVVLIVVGVLLLWYFGKSYIEAGVLYVKLAEIAFIKYALAIWSHIATFLHLTVPNLQGLDNWVIFINQQFGTMDFDTLVKVSTAVGDYLRYPIGLILFALAALLYFNSVQLKFKNTFTMKRLRDLEKENWPRIMPVANLKLIEKDLNEPPWAMAMTPMQFCKNHDLLHEETKDGKPVVSVIKGRAYNMFVLQLGPVWTGHVESLPQYMQALLAIFAARTNNDPESADKLLDQLAMSAAAGQLNYSGTRALLVKHLKSKPVTKRLQKHAYVLTMMASMLDLARGAGVLATADFIWLKPVDRRLWYVLNSVGRQTAVPEVAGVFAHWISELKFEWPIKTPMVEAAVNGLAEAITEIIYEPEED